MAQTKGETALTVLWSVGLYGWGFVLAGQALMAPEYNAADPAVYKYLVAMGASYILLAVGVAMSLSAPIPANPLAGPVAARLKLGWAMLALCPPPSRALRTALALAAAAQGLYPFHGASFEAWFGAAALLAAGPLLERPKADLSFSLMDLAFIGGVMSVGLAGLSLTGSEVTAEVWRGVGVFAALTGLVAQRTRELCAGLWKQLLPNVPPPPALDLSRYEVTVERKGPEKRAELPAGVEAQLVDSGSFKVDAAKMLDKLRNYQLSDPNDFVCAWLRCATASGATYIQLTTRLSGLELSFDGRAFSASELSQPYQALVDAEGVNGKRGRHFAYGLLGLYRLRPRGVSVTSRGPDGVAAMSAGSGEAPDPAEAPEGTVIRVAWPMWAAFWRPFLVAHRARQRYGLGSASLTVDGTAVPDRPVDPGWTTINDAGWRGVRRLPQFRNTVRLYVLGTFIEELAGEDLPSVEAWLTHDDLELDISQSSVVRGRRLDAGLKRL